MTQQNEADRYLVATHRQRSLKLALHASLLFLLYPELASDENFFTFTKLCLYVANQNARSSLSDKKKSVGNYWTFKSCVNVGTHDL